MFASNKGEICRFTYKKKAAQVVAHQTAELPFNGDEEKQGNYVNPEYGNDTSISFSPTELAVEAFAEAFPGQSVRNGMPNRERRAMHHARSLALAVERKDIVLAFSYRRALDRATSPIPTSRSSS